MKRVNLWHKICSISSACLILMLSRTEFIDGSIKTRSLGEREIVSGFNKTSLDDLSSEVGSAYAQQTLHCGYPPGFHLWLIVPFYCLNSKYQVRLQIFAVSSLIFTCDEKFCKLNAAALVKHAIESYPGRIFVSSVHPGAVDTEIQDQVKSAFGQVLGTILTTLQTPFLRTPGEGSIGTLWAALSPEIEEKNYQGVYIPDPGKIGGETKQTQDPTLEKNVWDLCHRLMTGKMGKDGLLPWNEELECGVGVNE
ncbi:hypothetical protein FRB98_008449 [Tulasnella sp. 332]|nr:hypothetical protein FRB98_008449 [Tulasnella sp. 332]